MTYPLTPRQDRIRVLRARRVRLDALIQRLEEAERQDGDRATGATGDGVMSDPVHIGDVLPEVIAELLEREGRSAVSSVAEGDSGAKRDKMGAQIKTAPRPAVDAAGDPQGLARRYEGAPN